MTVVIDGSTGISLDYSSGYPRITGDFSNATVANRVTFQTSAANSSTVIAAMPSGSGTASAFRAYSSNDPDNTSIAGVTVVATLDARFASDRTGTGTYLPMTFYTGGSERMRIDTSGNLLVGAASNPALSWTSVNRIYVDQSAADFPLHARNSSTTAANNYGVAISFAATPNGVGNAFIEARDSTAQRFQVRSNGGIANFSANNVNLSDARLKTDVQPATSYLQKICAIPVVTYLYKDQTDTELNLGVLAQDVEAVAPELVDTSGFGEAPEGEAPYKAIYQTDLQYALMKCIQEQQAMIEELKAKVSALEAR